MKHRDGAVRQQEAQPLLEALLHPLLVAIGRQQQHGARGIQLVQALRQFPPRHFGQGHYPEVLAGVEPAQLLVGPQIALGAGVGVGHGIDGVRPGQQLPDELQGLVHGHRLDDAREERIHVQGIGELLVVHPAKDHGGAREEFVVIPPDEIQGVVVRGDDDVVGPQDGELGPEHVVKPQERRPVMEALAVHEFDVQAHAPGAQARFQALNLLIKRRESGVIGTDEQCLGGRATSRGHAHRGKDQQNQQDAEPSRHTAPEARTGRWNTTIGGPKPLRQYYIGIPNQTTIVDNSMSTTNFLVAPHEEWRPVAAWRKTDIPRCGYIFVA